MRYAFSYNSSVVYGGQTIDDAASGIPFDMSRMDTLELMTPAGNHVFTLGHLESRHGESIAAAPYSGHVIKIFRPVRGAIPDSIHFWFETLLNESFSSPQPSPRGRGGLAVQTFIALSL